VNFNSSPLLVRCPLIICFFNQLDINSNLVSKCSTTLFLSHLRTHNGLKSLTPRPFITGSSLSMSFHIIYLLLNLLSVSASYLYGSNNFQTIDLDVLSWLRLLSFVPVHGIVLAKFAIQMPDVFSDSSRRWPHDAFVM